jgi:RHS repeat-associated protein
VNGSVVATYSYNAFGNTTATSSINNPFQYTGREWDSETGLYYYRARYYEPQARRFISEDPRLALGFSLSIAETLAHHFILFIRLQIDFRLACDIYPLQFAILETEKGARLRAPFPLKIKVSGVIHVCADGVVAYVEHFHARAKTPGSLSQQYFDT